MQPNALKSVRIATLVIAFCVLLSPQSQASESVIIGELERCSATIEGEAFEYKDACSTNSSPLQSTTIDVRVTDDRAKMEYLKIGLPLAGLRTSGPFIQVYYSGALGKAQWFPLDNLGGLVVMPNGVDLPMQKWVDQGLRIGSFLRVVIATVK